MPHACLLGNLSGLRPLARRLSRSAGDLFWSPADWAWTGGLMDALLPTLYFGQPIVGYRGRFDPERALALMAKLPGAQLVPVPDRAQDDDEGGARGRASDSTSACAAIMSAGEAVGTTVFEWARDALGVTINEMFGQTEMNYIVGNSHAQWPAKPGSMGRPYPGPSHRGDRRRRPRRSRRGEIGDVAVHRIAPDGTPDPVFFLEYFGIRTARAPSSPATGAAPATSRASTPTATSGTRAAPTTCSRPPATASARPRSRTASSGIRRSPTPPWCRRPTRRAATSSRRSSCSPPGTRRRAALEDDIQQHVRHHLAPYEYPKEIEFIDALPMTTTGKVQRKVLRERERARKAAARRHR